MSPDRPAPEAPSARERAEAARALIEALAEAGPQEIERLRQRLDAPRRLLEQAAADLWGAGLVACEVFVRAGTARTRLALTDAGRNLAGG